jgi:hypothetical protein
MRGLWGAIGCCLVAAACSSSGKAGGTATVPGPTAPPTTADPWAVPAVITVPYVNRVLAELNHIDGNAVRSARAANAITPEFMTLEKSINATQASYEATLELWQRSVSQNWKDISETPGDVISTVLKLLDTSPSCVVASVREDFSPEGPGGVGVYPNWWIALLPSTTNVTHWAYVFDGFESSPTPGGVPINACAGV